jgi:hypothetical protein
MRQRFLLHRPDTIRRPPQCSHIGPMDAFRPHNNVEPVCGSGLYILTSERSSPTTECSSQRNPPENGATEDARRQTTDDRRHPLVGDLAILEGRAALCMLLCVHIQCDMRRCAEYPPVVTGVCLQHAPVSRTHINTTLLHTPFAQVLRVKSVGPEPPKARMTLRHHVLSASRPE